MGGIFSYKTLKLYNNIVCWNLDNVLRWPKENWTILRRETSQNRTKIPKITKTILEKRLIVMFCQIKILKPHKYMKSQNIEMLKRGF